MINKAVVAREKPDTCSQMTPSFSEVEARARLSHGTSMSAVYAMVARALFRRRLKGGTVIDVGCGKGELFRYLGTYFDRYVGIDAVSYPGTPPEIEFYCADLGSVPTQVPGNCGDVVAAIETIEHLENPRALCRELDRLAKPGGWIVITTPNQLSLLSLATLICKKQFNAFQASSYPAHLTALLEIDLRRMAAECNWENVEVEYSGQGRIVFTGRHYPGPLSQLFPRACSDNVILIARKPILVLVHE